MSIVIETTWSQATLCVNVDNYGANVIISYSSIYTYMWLW